MRGAFLFSAGLALPLLAGCAPDDVARSTGQSQTKISLRAAPVIATTAGCLIFLSTVIA